MLGVLWDRVWAYVDTVWTISSEVATTNAFWGAAAIMCAGLYWVLSHYEDFLRIVVSASKPGALYLRIMWSVQDRLAEWFGKPWSSQAFVLCVIIAFVYPLLFLVVAWVSGAQLVLAGKPVFPLGLAIEERLGIAFVLIALIIGLYQIGKLHARFAGSLRRVLPMRWRDHGLVVSLSDYFVVASAVAVAVAGASAGAGAGAVAVAGAVAGAFAVAVAVAFAGAGKSQTFVVLVVMFMLLPIVNALFDWVSWAISRWLLFGLVGPRMIASGNVRPRRADWGLLAVHGLADAAVALLLLIGLAVVLPALFQSWNALAAMQGWSSVEWWLYLHDARQEPFGKGVFVTAMLLSTLLPTLAHTFAVLLALMLPVLQPRGRGGRPLLETWLYGADKSSRLLRINAVFFILLCALASAALLTAVIIFLVALISVAGVPMGACLADTALQVGLHFGPPLPLQAALLLEPTACRLLP